MATPIAIINQVQGLFAANNWTVSDDTKSTFDAFCEVLVGMSEDERSMLLDLSRDFRWIRFSDYPLFLKPLLTEALNSLDGKKRIFLVPLLARKHYLKTKSSKFVYYWAGGPMFHGSLPSGSTGHLVDTPEALKQYECSANDAIVAVDDFIGSGRTCATVHNEIAHYSGGKASVTICAMFGMNDSLAKLENAGIEVRVRVILNRGISANPRLSAELRSFYQQLMTGVEKRLDVSPKYYFGFERSESLLSFDRVPNNTFPVYWAEKEKPNIMRRPPFFRVSR